MEVLAEEPNPPQAPAVRAPTSHYLSQQFLES